MENKNKVTHEAKCLMCNTVVTLEVVAKDLEDWKSGTLIQRALPYLSPGERELLISGTCDGCWEAMFGIS